jgi:predicted lipoprotein with Yx(FWY)xxD motif
MSESTSFVTERDNTMKLRSILAAPIAVVAAGVLLTACGQSGVAGSAQISAAAAAETVSAAPVATTPTAAAAVAKDASAEPVAQVAEVEPFGSILVGEGGRTLYAFTDDVNGESTCFDACAAAWPAAVVTDGFTPPEGVDPALVSTVDRPEGSEQLKVGKWPLYYYAGDGAQGETNGQGVGGVWYVVKADGTLIKGEAAEPAPAAESTPAAAAAPEYPDAEPAPEQAATGPVVALAEVGNLGAVMVGANGHTLYAFTDDPEKQTTCFDACAEAWPPLTVPDDFAISPELEASGASTIERPDGTKQLVMGKWALYYYAGDGAPGEANGQGVGGKWYAIDGNCKLVKTAA